MLDPTLYLKFENVEKKFCILYLVIFVSLLILLFSVVGFLFYEFIRLIIWMTS
jgi:hypothetical protein